MTVELYHGKSWDVLKELHALMMGDQLFDCVLTDPPYGMDFQSTYGKDEEAREAYQRKIADDHDVEVAIKNFHRTFKAMQPFLNPDRVEMYVFSHWHVMGEWKDYLEALEPWGFKLKQLLVWNKGWPGIGDVITNWGAGHEFIFYLKRGNRRMPYRRSGVLNFDKVRPGTNVHPSQKPTALLKTLIEMSTSPGDWILDPYAGSASTLVAARECERNAVGIEMDDDYYERGKTALSSHSLFDV